MEIERRNTKIEIRTGVGEAGAPVMHGVAAVFNSMSEDLGGFREMITTGAFASALISSDVRALFNHKPSFILGRSTSGTLRLAETFRGLEFDCDLPATSYSHDLQISLKRGDIRECSFGFNVAEGGDTWEKDGAGRWIRTIRVVSRLYDVSPVTFAAYQDTSCALRSLEKKQAGLKPTFNDMYFRRLRLEMAEAEL